MSHRKEKEKKKKEIKEAISLVLESISLGITDLLIMIWEEAFACAGYS